MAWPLPGTHIPNQFVAQIIGAGGSIEAAAFWNHAIIVGYLDTQLGFISAAPSVNAARFSGKPSLYCSKYSWSQPGLGFINSPQGYWNWRVTADWEHNLKVEEYKSKRKVYNDQVLAWKRNKAKCYYLVLSHCPRALEHQLKNSSKWDETESNQDVVALL